MTAAISTAGTQMTAGRPPAPCTVVSRQGAAPARPVQAKNS